MSIISASESARTQLFTAPSRKTGAQTEDFASALKRASTTSSKSTASAGTTETSQYRSWALAGNLAGIYNVAGQVVGKAAPVADKQGGTVDLTAEVRQAKENGYEVSMETLGKLCSPSSSAFIEGVCEVTDKTPAQVMTALLNMSSSEAAGFCQSLAELTGCDASAFTPMVSELTGHDEKMLQQCLNGEEEDDEDKNKSKPKSDESQSSALDGLNYQRDFNTVASPSINVTV